MSIDRKAHLRVGGVTLAALIALLLVGTRGKATAQQPVAPAAATATPTAPRQVNPYGGGDHDGFRHRGFGRGGGPDDGGGGAAPTTPAPSTGTGTPSTT